MARTLSIYLRGIDTTYPYLFFATFFEGENIVYKFTKVYWIYWLIPPKKAALFTIPWSNTDQKT